MAAPRVLRLLPRQRRARLAARRPPLGWPGQPGDALVDLPGGHRGRAGPSRRPGRRARARRRLHVRGRRGWHDRRLGVGGGPGRAARGAAPQLEPDRIGQQPVAGRGRRRPRARLRHRRDPLLHGQGRPGRGPGRPRAARRRDLSRRIHHVARTRSRPCCARTPPRACGPCSCARPSAPPAPVRSTRSARSPRSPASTARGFTSTPPGPGSRRSARSTGGCSTASSSPTRSAPTPTSGCSRHSTPRCCGCATRRRCPPPCRSPRSTCATPRATRAPWSTTATGRSRWAAASGR